MSCSKFLLISVKTEFLKYDFYVFINRNGFYRVITKLQTPDGTYTNNDYISVAIP